MEIPIINRITSDFDIGISTLQNPTFLSQILAVSGSGLDQLYRQRYNFVTWGALIIALLASFTTIINRFKLLVIKIRSYYQRSLYNYQPILNGDDFDDYESDSDTSCSSSDDEEEQDDDDDDEEEENFGTEGQNSHFSIRRRRNGKSVIKFWDNLGFNFSSDNLIALYDSVSFNGLRAFDSDDNVAGSSSFGGGAWDTRAASKILAEWMPRKQDFLDKVNHFCVTDDVRSMLTAAVRGDVNSPLAHLTEADVDDVWWDAGTESVTRH